MKLQSILQTIGNTPIIELKRYAPNRNIKIYAKLENLNPSGSIKDRIAAYMIKQAIKRGELIKQELIEPTTGNTGISLAMVSSILGFKFTAVMPERVSLERRKFLKAYGANIILTKDDDDIKIAKNIITKYPKKYFMLNQFANQDNVIANYLTTGAEIINQIPNITHFVAGIGTAGTLIGVGKKLKEYHDKIQIIGLNPKFPTKIQGLRNLNHFQPKIFDPKVVDRIISIDDEKPAFSFMQDLSKNTGLFVGISSGAALWGAIHVAKTIKKGSIVTIFPDSGNRYLSLL